MATPAEWLTNHVRHDHQRLLERLRSLDHALETGCYRSEAAGDRRGFNGLRLRCRELREILRQHIPEEEQMFARLKTTEEKQVLVRRLLLEHRALTASLDACLETLDRLSGEETLPQDLFTLQERVRSLCYSLQDHITTEERLLISPA